MTINKLFIYCFIICLTFKSNAQNDMGFQFNDDSKKRDKIKFKNFNNLIIVEAELNGEPLNFLLDTGVDKTILFGIEGDEELIKNNSTKISIRGVSGKKEAYAYKNENNKIELGELKDTNHDVYVIFDKDFNISDKIGYQLQGVLGYNFFKNHVIKINYIKNHLKIYDSKDFDKPLNSYDALTMNLFMNKPYITAQVKQDDTFEDYVFLLDIGSGDSIWLKPQTDQTLPEKSFYDILGYGFADIIYGHRSNLNSFKLGDKVIEKPKIAYPDSLAYDGLTFTPKSGTIGSEIMRRFHWYFDYGNRKVYFKTNNHISDPFNYDMSGLVLKYNGYQIMTEYSSFFSDIKVKTGYSAGFNKIGKYKKVEGLKIKPVLLVGAVRPNSPAFEAGFVEGDEILTINGTESFKFDLQKISKLLSSKEGLRVNFQIKRNGSIYNKYLILKSRFPE